MGGRMGVIRDEFLNAAELALPELALPELADKLEAIALRLIMVGSSVNLTSITEPSSVVWLHLIDSLYAAKAIVDFAPPQMSVADIGSGGGFPALPIAAAYPKLSVTAVDSTEKKCVFIRETAEKLSLGNLSAVSVRAEEYARTEARERFGAVTARAVARLNILMELCLPLTAIGGCFVAMKGSSADEEAVEARSAAKRLGAELCDRISYSLSDYADDRTLLIYRKTSATPPEFPRQYSRIRKAPL